MDPKKIKIESDDGMILEARIKALQHDLEAVRNLIKVIENNWLDHIYVSNKTESRFVNNQNQVTYLESRVNKVYTMIKYLSILLVFTFLFVLSLFFVEVSAQTARGPSSGQSIQSKHSHGLKRR
jgi:ATP-dependent Zn protease